MKELLEQLKREFLLLCAEGQYDIADNVYQQYKVIRDRQKEVKKQVVEKYNFGRRIVK